MARIDSTRRRPVVKRDERQDEFYETMAAPMNHSYRSETGTTTDAASGAERAVRTVAAILNTLLAIRFIAALFTSDTTNPVLAVVFNATNWLVTPFQAMFGNPPSGGGGYFDLPALATIVAIAVVAWAIRSVIRTNRERSA